MNPFQRCGRKIVKTHARKNVRRDVYGTPAFGSFVDKARHLMDSINIYENSRCYSTRNHYMRLALLWKGYNNIIDVRREDPNQSPKDPGKPMKQNSTPHCHIDHMLLRGLLFRTQDFVKWQSVVKENRTNSEPSIWDLTLMHLGNCGRNSPWNNTTSQTVRSFPVRLQRAVCFRIMLRQGTLPPSAVAHKTSGALLLKLQTKLRLGCQPTHQSMRCSKQLVWSVSCAKNYLLCGFIGIGNRVAMIHHKAYKARASNIGYFGWNPEATYQHASCNIYHKFS